MMPSYKNSVDYIEYTHGFNGHRHPAIPPFEVNDSGELKITLGEVYCRFQNSEGEFCSVDHKFSSDWNLRTHMKTHKVAVESRTTKGTITQQESAAAQRFYRELMNGLRGADAISAKASQGVGKSYYTPNPRLATPTKTPSKFPKALGITAGMLKWGPASKVRAENPPPAKPAQLAKSKRPRPRAGMKRKHLATDDEDDDDDLEMIEKPKGFEEPHIGGGLSQDILVLYRNEMALAKETYLKEICRIQNKFIKNATIGISVDDLGLDNLEATLEPFGQ